LQYNPKETADNLKKSGASSRHPARDQTARSREDPLEIDVGGCHLRDLGLLLPEFLILRGTLPF